MADDLNVINAELLELLDDNFITTCRKSSDIFLHGTNCIL